MIAGGLTGRPLRALAGLGLLVALWIGLRLPAMQHDVQALVRLTTGAGRPQSPRMPVPMTAKRPDGPVMAALLRPTLPPLLALSGPLRLPPVPSQPLPVSPPPLQTAPPPPAAPPSPPAADPPASVPRSDPAFTLANAAYDRLRTGQRRQAAALFDAALALQPGNGQWRADRAALGRRWQLGGFALLRDGGPLPGPAASPVLGGGQVGGSIAFVADPYARRPLALVARANVAADPQGVRGETAQLALGLRQALLPGVSVSVERLIPLGAATQGAFTARLAAGASWQRLDAYGEAGVLDTGQIYAGGQARARAVRFGPATLNAATWASVQTGRPDVWRVDVGPQISANVKGIRIEADWRQRVGGNAAPGSGPVLTVSAGF